MLFSDGTDNTQAPGLKAVVFIVGLDPNIHIRWVHVPFLIMRFEC